jgi:hypothetical protein
VGFIDIAKSSVLESPAGPLPESDSKRGTRKVERG